MKKSDIRIIFPDREKRFRTQRGFAPRIVVSAPTFDEMVNTAHGGFLFSYSEIDAADKKSRSKDSLTTFFYLLQRTRAGENQFGYLRLRDWTKRPMTLACPSYDHLNMIYHDVRLNVVWRKSLQELVDCCQHAVKCSGHNINFFNKVKEQYKDLFVPAEAAGIPNQENVNV